MFIIFVQRYLHTEYTRTEILIYLLVLEEIHLFGEVAGDDSGAEVGDDIGDEDDVGERVEDNDLRRGVVVEERHYYR